MKNTLDTYTRALKACKCGCLFNHKDDQFIIRSDLWYINSNLLQQQRKGYSEAEKDKVIKEALFHKLKETKFENSSTHAKLEFQLQFETGEEGKTKKISLCETCFVIFNDHKSERTWRKWKSEMKSNIIILGFAAEAAVSFSKKCKEKGVSSRYENVDEARKYLEPLGFNDHQYFQWACVPETDAAREAYLWMYSFFGLVGDCAPNRNHKIQLPGIYTKESIHSIYQHHVTTLYTSNEHEPLELQAFKTLWNNVFPNVSITKYCQVSGKCFTCHSLYERQECFTCEQDLQKIKQLSVIHKILIEMQRGAYMHNRQLAQENPRLYFSLIIDGMAQDHTTLPYFAGKFKETGQEVKQKIIGAKQHGFSRTFYRFFPHVQSGANMAIEVLLHEIERRMDYCIKTGEPFPRWLFLQIDGGPDNTSKVFYAINEYLVRLGLFDDIEVARLPVGHTHEDIDALFGVLWRAAQGKTIITPEQWKEMALSAFKDE